MGMLDGRVAVVTGAGNGIGRAVALGLAAAGAKVVVNDYGVTVDGREPSAGPAQAVVREIEAAGGRAVASAASVATMAGGQAAVDAALERFGDLHIVVCCAGILRERMIFNMTEEEWDFMRPVIAGVHEFPERKTARSALEIQALSARAALADAGLSARDVDGYFTATPLGAPGPLSLLDYLDLNPRHIDGTTIGGASFVAHVSHAACAIRQGRCRVALITYGSTARSSGVAVGTRERLTGEYLDQFEGVYGTTTVGLYALVAQRHMHEYGTTSAQLAEIAVVARRHAGLNPLALHRDPITVEDVLRSPTVSSPLHLLDCCVITDGGGAVVMVDGDRAPDLPRPPVEVLGAGEAVAHAAAGRRDYLRSAAAQSAPPAFGEAGVSRDDIDMAMIYDSFTVTVLLTLEDLGFCRKGEGGHFVEGGRLGLGGALPTNTDGGGLSSNHPGMRGIFLVIEAVKQLRGECGPRQVEDCRLALVHGTGGALGSRHSGATLILGRA